MGAHSSAFARILVLGHVLKRDILAIEIEDTNALLVIVE
jgi:hypothetical protein